MQHPAPASAVDGDLLGLRFGGEFEVQGQETVLHLRGYLLAIDLLGEQERARERALLTLPGDGQRIVFQRDVDVVRLEAGYRNLDRVTGLVPVDLDAHRGWETGEKVAERVKAKDVDKRTAEGAVRPAFQG